MSIKTHIVWLDGSKRPPSAPIRRRWRLSVGGRVVVSIPLRTVEWSRHAENEEER